MTMEQASAQVHSQASIDVRSIVLPRAQWETSRTPEGQPAFLPQKGTWYGYVIRGRIPSDVTVVPMIGCPSCGGALFLSHSPGAARFLSKMLGAIVPVAHRIDHLGKVSPDLLCKHGG